MITEQDCIKKYGIPQKYTNMTLWNVPDRLRHGAIPKRIYCNKDLIEPLEQAFKNLHIAKLVDELETWDGCFNIRMKKGGKTYSLHSWGIAIDVNAKENCFGCEPKLSPEFVKCFTDAGFVWGGTWKKPDGMHFQLSKI